MIAGTARGRRLVVPVGTSTRPTADRVREAMYSSLHSLLELAGARVLDLYAGSGALGLEALSRGAAEVTFVEDAREALAVLETNVAHVGLPGAQVVRTSVEAFLAGRAEPVYALAMLDPPYVTDVLPALHALRPWLTDDAIVVCERSTRTGTLDWPEGYEPVRPRRYGDTTLWYAASASVAAP